MAWINQDDAQWEPRAFYWLMTVIAAFIAIFAVGDFFISWAQGAPILRVVALIAALVVWLIGFICSPLPA
jgi:hypothetical protein